MDQFKGPSEAARGNRRFALFAMAGLAAATVFMYRGSKDIAKGAWRRVAKQLRARVVLMHASPVCVLSAGADEIKSTADHVKDAVVETKNEVERAATKRR